jgi:hypothetical protein
MQAVAYSLLPFSRQVPLTLFDSHSRGRSHRPAAECHRDLTLEATDDRRHEVHAAPVAKTVEEHAKNKGWGLDSLLQFTIVTACLLDEPAHRLGSAVNLDSTSR